MTYKNDRSQGKRIRCDFLNNLSSVDLFYEEKSWNKTPCKKMLGLYSAERLIATKRLVSHVRLHIMSPIYIEISMCFYVFSCFPYVSLVSSCFSMFFPNSPCFPLFFYVSLCFPMFFYVFSWFPLLSLVFLRFPLFFYVFSWFSLLSLVFLRFPLFFFVFFLDSPRFPVFFYVFLWFPPAFLCFFLILPVSSCFSTFSPGFPCFLCFSLILNVFPCFSIYHLRSPSGIYLRSPVILSIYKWPM